MTGYRSRVFWLYMLLEADLDLNHEFYTEEYDTSWVWVG